MAMPERSKYFAVFLFAACSVPAYAAERPNIIFLGIDSLRYDEVLRTDSSNTPNVDAFLWVKRVGESDGSCGRGEPGAGTFVNQYAIDLALNAGK